MKQNEPKHRFKKKTSKNNLYQEYIEGFLTPPRKWNLSYFVYLKINGVTNYYYYVVDISNNI